LEIVPSSSLKIEPIAFAEGCWDFVCEEIGGHHSALASCSGEAAQLSALAALVALLLEIDLR
jgi:hypothetical protein